MPYDNSNIFAKILRKEISCDIVYEDDNILCFHDINPVSSIHVLIVPKKQYVSFDDFIQNAETELITLFFKKIQIIAEKLNLNKEGYRIVSNHRPNANQEVPHFHIHILGGENLGSLISIL